MKRSKKSFQNTSAEKTAKRSSNNIPFGYEVDNPSAEYMKYKVFDEPYSGAVNETYYTKNLKFAKNFLQKTSGSYMKSLEKADLRQ